MFKRCIVGPCGLKASVGSSLCHRHAAQTPADKVRMLELLDEVHERAIGGLAVDRIDALEALEAAREEVLEWWKGG